MRKAVIAVLGVFVLLTGSIYFFIPGKINITDYALANANSSGTYRVLSDTGEWTAWWPRDPQTDHSGNFKLPPSFTLNNYSYIRSEKLYNAITISIHHRKIEFHSLLMIFELPGDSVLLQWKSTLNAGFNPVKRLLRYRQAVQIKKNMTIILKSLQSFLHKNENIYGYPISQVIVKDSFLVAIKKIFPHYPNTADVYALIGQLQIYNAGKGARPTNYPMLDVMPLGNNRFETRVAIPVDRPLKNNGGIIAKQLITRGKLVIATVTGGTYAINRAFIQLKAYTHDYKKIIVAIPFESLVTNRLQEPDSAKWVTKVCYPVM